MANQVLGTCRCPLPWCGADGAEVRQGEKGRAYLVCDSCVTMVRSQSRAGHNGMVALVPVKAPTPAAVAVAPAPTPAPEKPAAPPKKKAAAWYESFGVSAEEDHAA